MQNLAASTNVWADSVRPESSQAAETRRAYARKRSADEARERSLTLSQVVQADIIPRLRLLHPSFVKGPSSANTSGVGETRSDPELKPDGTLVATFTDLVLGEDVSALCDFFDGLTAKGYAPDCLFIDLLAPSAALLGRLWDEDLCDFIEVTTGVARLQVLLSRFRSEEGLPLMSDKRRVLMMGSPGEKHTFGIAIVEQFLRQAGWQVTSGLAASPEEIADLVAKEWFGVVGLTLSCETRLDGLTRAIQAVKRASRNKAVGVMVGGPVFLEHPDFVERVGADASAVDAPTAVLLAQRLLDFGLRDSRAAQAVQAR